MSTEDPFGYRTPAATDTVNAVVADLVEKNKTTRRRLNLLFVFFCVSSLFGVAALSSSESNRADIRLLATCRVMTDAEIVAQREAEVERRRVTNRQDRALCDRACLDENDRPRLVSASCSWDPHGMRVCACRCSRDGILTHTPYVSESR